MPNFMLLGRKTSEKQAKEGGGGGKIRPPESGVYLKARVR